MKHLVSGVDLFFSEVNKSDVKRILKAIDKGIAIPGKLTSNWKKGNFTATLMFTESFDYSVDQMVSSLAVNRELGEQIATALKDAEYEGSEFYVGSGIKELKQELNTKPNFVPNWAPDYSIEFNNNK